MKAPVNLTRSDSYLAKKATLSGERLLSLELVEQVIAADPHGRLHRRDALDGAIIDTSEPFMLVIYRLVGEHTAHLIGFVDQTTDL